MTANTHHTKLKGDIAVAAVILDLTKKGYIISEPMSENAPYDLICDTGKKLLRIQVKYRANGELPSSTSWNDKNGNHKNKIDTTKIDYFALVNEDLLICYPLPTMLGKTIRFKKPIGYYNPYHFYKDYLDFKEKIMPMHINIKNRVEEDILNITEEEVLNAIKKSYYKSDACKKLNISSRIFTKLLIKFNIKFEDYCLIKENNKLKQSLKCNLDFEIIKKRLKNKETIKTIAKEFNISSAYLSSILTNEGIYASELPEQQDVLHPTKIEWPSIEEMTKLVWEKSTVVLAKELGVSDVAIAKFCKKHNIPKPERGYWAKQTAQS